MKGKPTQYAKIASGALVALLVGGCAQQQQHGKYTKVQPTYPAYTTFEQDGTRWVRGTMAYPTGHADTSGLVVEKTVPAEVLVGQKFDYAIKVSNVTTHTIQMVTISDRVSPNFVSSQAEPNATEVREGVAMWQLGTLEPSESKIIHVKGTSLQEGSVDTCGWASFSPVLCQNIRVLRPELQLSHSAPAEALLCDAIPVTVTVKNTGSAKLTEVKVTDKLPEGLTSDGKNTLSFDAGTLAPGESREFQFSATASAIGNYASSSQATCAQNVQAEASSATAVKGPILTLSCTSPGEQYVGRSLDVGLTVLNKGDAAAGATVIEMPIPEGLIFKAASANGQASGNKVTWDMGSLAPNASEQVSATFLTAAGGTFQFAPTAKATCATMVAAAAQTRVSGLAGILLEKSDSIDPVGVEETTTYTVKVTNQGSAEDKNLHVVVKIAPELTPVSAGGGGVIAGQTVTFPVVPSLAPKGILTYQITVKGVKPGDGRTVFELTSDMLTGPVVAQESTHVY